MDSDVTVDGPQVQEFKLSASEDELLEEFGVLLAAEYNYATPVW